MAHSSLRPKTASQDMSAGIASCPANTGYLAHHRHTQSEIYYIISGKGEVTVDGNVHAVTGGSTVFIPGDAEHGIKNTGEQELKWFYVFPTASFGDVEYNFSEVEKVDERVDEFVPRKEPPVLKIYGWDAWKCSISHTTHNDFFARWMHFAGVIGGDQDSLCITIPQNIKL
jgi:mannose-6-phosphate isomerase-like protein (cupin superfamily)